MPTILSAGMYLANPKRLLTVLSGLVIVLVAIWFVFLRSSGPSTPSPIVVQPTPVVVSQILRESDAQPRVVVAQQGKGFSIIHSVNQRAAISLTEESGKITALQKGRTLYTRAGACYLKSTATASSDVSAIVNESFPIGGDTNYTYPHAGEIDWTIHSAANARAFSPHGSVTFSTKTHLLLTAISYTATGEIIHVYFTYPSSLAAKVPSTLCRTHGQPIISPALSRRHYVHAPTKEK